MSENSKPQVIKYFAAANSFNGFVSFFDVIFPSKEFDRIYVLKGGPGTGKSSFMKKMSAALKDRKCEIDEIYCSSDPHSLDGIIAKKGSKKIAIIDGTAPHERDAVIPGAIDEIINLGESWDSRWLTAKKDKILEVGKDKSLAYQTGYSYLKIAGSADELINRTYETIFDKNKAKIKADEILSDISTSTHQEIKTKLISSFGRYGLYKIEENFDQKGRVIRVFGDEFASTVFLDQLKELAATKGLSFTHLPTPLDPSHTEGIYFENANLTVVKSDSGEINAGEFIANDRIYSEKSRRAKELRKSALEEAERWFSIASDLHFQLEEIYGAAMNFEKNDEIFDRKLGEIDNILQN